jgi:NapH/MauN family ferredoxin-type protein
MNKTLLIRRLIQAAVFGLLAYLSWSHLKYGIERAASIDAYCPFGAAESLLTKIVSGNYLQRIWTSSFILMAITIVVTLVFGRVFCSYLCPLGAVQEWLRALGRKIGLKKDIKLPAVIDRYARYLKYPVLVLVVYLSYLTGDLFFRNYDPYNAMMHFGNEFDEKIPAYAILGAIAVSGLISKNWWCRYLCPLGAFLGILKKISPFKIKRDTSTCVSCGNCHHVCPANLDVDKKEITRSADCISCQNCVSECPESSLSSHISKFKITSRYFGLVAALSFFVPLGLFTLTPWWQTKAPSNITAPDQTINVANIRGSNTLKTVIAETGVPLVTFIKELGLPEDIDTSLMLKEIGIKYNIKNKDGGPLETEDFRAVISGHVKSEN